VALLVATTMASLSPCSTSPTGAGTLNPTDISSKASDTPEKASENPAAEGEVKVVVQRCEAAELLVDNEDTWVAVGRALVVFVSFSLVIPPPFPCSPISFTP